MLTAKLVMKARYITVSDHFSRLHARLTKIVTAVSASQAAISILRDGHNLSGGIYTPACLGQKFIDRLDGAGFKLEKKFFEN